MKSMLQLLIVVLVIVGMMMLVTWAIQKQADEQADDWVISNYDGDTGVVHCKVLKNFGLDGTDTWTERGSICHQNEKERVKP